MEAKLQSLKVPELKALLTKANQPITGVKADLVARLLQHPEATASLNGNSAASATEAAPASEASAAVKPAANNAEKPAAPSATPAEVEAEPTTPPTPESTEEERKQALIAELEKRKARAAKFGQPTDEIEAKLERVMKFGIDPTEEAAVGKVSESLGNKSRRERKEKAPKKDVQEKETKKSENEKISKKAAASIPASKPEMTEEEKAALQARMEEEKEKARKRAERFGTGKPAAPAATTEDEEKKRKRDEKFGASQTDKKVKT